MRRRLAARAVGSVLGALILGAGCTSAPSSSTPPAGDALRLGLSGIQTLDPSAASPADADQQVLADLLHDTLTEVDADGEVGPGLAAFTSGDLVTWSFVLAGDATFADGTPVTADDVVFSIDRVRGRGASSLAALQLEDVAAVRATGERTVEIELLGPSAVLPEVLSAPQFGIVQRASIEAATQAVRYEPLGSGDYAVTVDAADRLTLFRRAGRDGPEEVVVRLFPGPDEALGAFLDGELDWTPISPDAVGAVGPDQVEVTPFHATLLLALNDDEGGLDDRGLRRAVSLAVDRDALAESAAATGAIAARGLVPTGVDFTSSDRCVSPCGPSIDSASALVDDAVAAGSDRSLRLIVDGSAIQQVTADVLAAALADVGLELGVSPVEEETYEQLVVSGFQQMFLYATVGVSRTPTPYLRTSWTTDAPDNVTGYSNPIVDAAVERAVTTRDIEARNREWRAIESDVLGDALVIPLVQLTTTAAVDPRVERLRVRVDGTLDLSRVSLVGVPSDDADDVGDTDGADDPTAPTDAPTDDGPDGPSEDQPDDSNEAPSNDAG